MLRQLHRTLPLLALCSLGCKGQTLAPEQGARNSTAITREQLGNLSYPSELGREGRVQLRDGSFEAEPAGDASGPVIVRLTPHVAAGDLDGDGRTDAAVILESDSGGSGSFMDLAAVLNTPEGPKAVATIDLGDRTEIRSIAVNNGTVEIELIGHGPEDPVCCPTQVQRRSYRFDGQRWVTNERRAPP